MSDFVVLVHSNPFWSLIFGGFVPGLLIWWLNRLSDRIKELERTSNAQVKAIGRLHQLMVAHERYMRLAVKDGSFWAADQGGRTDVHERQLKKLDKVAHGHTEMGKR